MAKIHTQLILIGIGTLAACAEERQPRSVDSFLDNPIMLEAAMVRCSENRDATRYDSECVAARQASQLIEAREDATRRAEQEARSEKKRQALRRTQEAASQARERAAEAERLREEAAYLAQFGVAPPAADRAPQTEETLQGNTPLAVIPSGSTPPAATVDRGDTLPATDGGNAPVITSAPPPKEPESDLESIRNELQRRKDEGNE